MHKIDHGKTMELCFLNFYGNLGMCTRSRQICVEIGHVFGCFVHVVHLVLIPLVSVFQRATRDYPY